MFIDPRHLVQLSVIVGHKSFSRAAEQLGLTQPALSRNIRIMESRVGARLLERVRNDVRPTAAGARLAAHGAVIAWENQQAGHYADDLQKGASGEIRIGAPAIISDHALPKSLAAFAEQRPGAHFRVQTAKMAVLLERLTAGELDLAIGPIGILERRTALQVEPLLDDRLGLIARHNHRLSDKKVDLSDLTDAQWIAIGRQSFIRTQMDAALAALGLSNIDIAFECDSEAMMISLLQRTDCLTMLPRVQLNAEIEADKLAVLDFSHPALEHQIGLVHRGRGRLTRLQTALCDHLATIFEGLSPHADLDKQPNQAATNSSIGISAASRLGRER